MYPITHIIADGEVDDIWAIQFVKNTQSLAPLVQNGAAPPAGSPIAELMHASLPANIEPGKWACNYQKMGAQYTESHGKSPSA
jgi:hypothetical protein